MSTEITPEPRRSAFDLACWDDMMKMAEQVAKSGMFGISTPAQAVCMFAIAQAENINPLAVLKKYHLVEGKPTMKADAMLAEFQKNGGGVIYHIRTDKICAATYYSDKRKIDEEARKRAIERMELLLKIDRAAEDEDTTKLYLDLIAKNWEGEQTIVRTITDAKKKGIAMGKDGVKANWARYPRAMLAARCDTEGIRIVMPGIIVGVMEETEAREVYEMTVETAPQALPFKAQRDADSIKAMIDQYKQEAEIADPKRKKELLGLIADLKIDLEEIEFGIVKPVTHEVNQTIEAEIVEEGPKPAPWEGYCIKHVGGIYKGMLITDIKRDELELIAESMNKKAEKNPTQFKHEAGVINDYLSSLPKLAE